MTLSPKIEVNKKGIGSIVTHFRTRDYKSGVFNSNNPKIILRKRAGSSTPKVQSYKLWTTVTLAPKIEVNKKGIGSIVTHFRTRDYESRVFNSNNPKIILRKRAESPTSKVQSYKLWTTVTLSPKIKVNKKENGSVVTRFRTRDYESRVFNSNNPKIPLRKRAESPTPKIQSYKLWPTLTFTPKIEVNKKGIGSVVTHFRTRDLWFLSF